MKKTLAIIGASYLQRPLVERAKEMGLKTVCFSWAEGAVCKDICDEFYPVSITEKEEILRLCREVHIDGDLHRDTFTASSWGCQAIRMKQPFVPMTST